MFLRLARFAHAVAFDGLGQDHGRLAAVRVCRGVGGIDLVRVVAAAVQRQMSSSDQFATIAFNSGYLPKKCSRT